MSNKWAKHYMRENRNNQFRPEQITLYKQIRVTRPNSNIIMEGHIPDLKPVMDIEVTWVVGDIVDFTRKEIFRINGASHMGRETKDYYQRLLLEGNGWKVTDIDV